MEVRRIFCIGKNYAEHVKELAHLGHAPDAAPSASAGSLESSSMTPAGDCVVFMKPASCVVPAGQAITLPAGRGAIHHEAELVIRLGAGGVVTHLTLGLDLTLRDLQTGLKNKGRPWELAKAFDHAAPLGEWTEYRGQDLQALEFTCHVNGKLRQQGNTRDMLFPVARIIHILAQTWALQDGDVIFTGTPAGVGPLIPGDRITLEGTGLGRHEWHCT